MGILKIWNAAIAAPKRMIKVSPQSLLGVHPLCNDELLLKLSSGEIEVFNVKQSRLIFKVDVAHTN